MSDAPLLEVEGLRKIYAQVTALDDVSLAVERGETFAIAGASGSGKTTLARVILRLIEPDAGTVHFSGMKITSLSGAPLRALRRRMQMVFQDPLAAFNPRKTLRQALDAPLRIHDIVPRPERAQAIAALLGKVGLAPELAERYPHQISGGQRQRAAIARAIATKPDLIVLDEPVSALDVSIRAQVLNLLLDLQAELGIAYLLISHDLAIVRAMARKVAIMDSGRIVELGSAADVFSSPKAPATRALLNAVPRLG